MNATDVRARVPVGPRSAPASRRRLYLAVAATGGLALTMRLLLHQASFDVFGDEVIYADLGRSVMTGGLPAFLGQAFFLHGPAFFYLEAGWSWVVGKPPDLVTWIYEMRILNALLATYTAMILTVLGARTGSLRAGVATALLFALDPFCIRQNDRVLLETAMMLWVLLGYLVFLALFDGQPRRRERCRAVGAGLLFGCAVLTKDEAALLTVLPLAGAALLRWGPRRSAILLTLGATAAPYTVYVAVVAANGYAASWWSAKTSGVKRLLGVVQTTGFHSASGGSLTSRLVAEGGTFSASYVILALAVPAAVVVLRRGGTRQRFVALFYCSAAVTLAYAVTLGTLEEQELYLLVVPSLLIIPMAVTLRGGDRPHGSRVPPGRPRAPRAVAITATTALVAALVLNLAICIQWLRQPDDGFAQLLPYLAAHVPAGTTIDVAAGSPPPSQTDGGRYALQDRYRIGLWTTGAALRRAHVRYVMVEWGPIDDGYAYLDRAQVRALVQGTRLLFSFTGRTYGQLALYQVPS